MGKRTANNFADSSYIEIPGLFSSPSRIRDHAGGRFLSVTDHSDNRDIQSSGPTSSERQRYSLERLIASVNSECAALFALVLIKEFGTIGKILAQSKEALSRIIGNEDGVIQLLHAAREALAEGLFAEVPRQLVSSTDQSLIDYLVATMGSQPYEALRILFLDRGNHMIGDEILSTGSVHSMTVYPRTIFKRVFELSASAIVMVHNHPGGSVKPSECDINFTKTLMMLGKPLEITIKDHIVIADTKWYSFLRQGLI
jgi:DNA repair protein RadC